MAAQKYLKNHTVLHTIKCKSTKILENPVFLDVHRTKTLGIPVLLNGQSTKILENPVFLDVHRTKTLGIPVFLNGQSTKILENPVFLDVHRTKTLENPVFLNDQCTKMLENTVFDAVQCTRAAMACKEREEREGGKKTSTAHSCVATIVAGDAPVALWGPTLETYSKAAQAGTNLPSAKALPLAHYERGGG